MTIYELAKQVWENCIAPDGIAKNGYTVQDAAADLENFRASDLDSEGHRFDSCRAYQQNPQSTMDCGFSCSKNIPFLCPKKPSIANIK